MTPDPPIQATPRPAAPPTPPTRSRSRPSAARRRGAWLVRLVAVVALAAALWWLSDRAVAWIETMPVERQGLARLALWTALGLAQAVMIALPFVPGVEIGFALLMTNGAEAALPVWAATVTGLLAAFAAGRLIPEARLAAIFDDLRMTAAAALLRQVAPLGPRRRLVLLRRRLPRPLARRIVPLRYVVLALLWNLPGNAVLGGGGGISLLAGLSGIYSTRAVALTAALAIAPVPLAVWLWGGEMLGTG